MTAQHAPHTTPLWRQVLSLPHTRLGWWAIGLAVPFLFLNGLNILGWTLPLPELVGMAIWLTVILVALSGGILGLIAVGYRDRSLLVWVAQVPTALFFFILPNAFQEGSPWGRGSVGVLVWAVIAFSIIYILRSAARNNVRWFE